MVGGNYDGLLKWKVQEPDYIEMDRLICGDCDIATFARRFRYHADIPTFRQQYKSGIINSVNRTTTPWSPRVFDASPLPAGEFLEVLTAELHRAAQILR